MANHLAEEEYAVAAHRKEKRWWSWLRKHGAYVVVAFCFLVLPLLGLALALSLDPAVSVPILIRWDVPVHLDRYKPYFLGGLRAG